MCLGGGGSRSPVYQTYNYPTQTPTPTIPVPKQANKAEEEKAKIGKPNTMKELVIASSLRFEYLSAKNANDIRFNTPTL